MAIKSFGKKLTAAFNSTKHFEKHLTYFLLCLKIWIWEVLLSVTFLRLWFPDRDYSFCMDIFALDFWRYLKSVSHWNEISESLAHFSACSQIVLEFGCNKPISCCFFLKVFRFLKCDFISEGTNKKKNDSSKIFIISRISNWNLKEIVFYQLCIVHRMYLYWWMYSLNAYISEGINNFLRLQFYTHT